jgi:hypothetical protein
MKALRARPKNPLSSSVTPTNWIRRKTDSRLCEKGKEDLDSKQALELETMVGQIVLDERF